jgi:hypothetical protein
MFRSSFVDLIWFYCGTLSFLLAWTDDVMKLACGIAVELDIEADSPFAVLADRSCRLKFVVALGMAARIVVWSAWFAWGRNVHRSFP